MPDKLQLQGPDMGLSSESQPLSKIVVCTIVLWPLLAAELQAVSQASRFLGAPISDVGSNILSGSGSHVG
jgi:hypothetical protein